MPDTALSTPAAPTAPARPSSLRVHQFHGLRPGPRLIVLGAVHGNEVAGPMAIGRALAELDAGRWRIERGMVTFVPVTNPLAHALGQRTGDRNLNRNLRPTAVPQDFEDRIGNVLCPLLDAHDVLLDLHSFNGPGEAFTLFGPEDNQGDLEPFAHAADEARLARHLGPRRIVEGWLRTYEAGVARRDPASRNDLAVPPENAAVDEIEVAEGRQPDDLRAYPRELRGGTGPEAHAAGTGGA